MEYVAGQDLSDWLKANGPVPEAQALAWIDQVLDAVDYLHTRPQPVIHRDIKPGNIRLLSDGSIKLIDFGIIKIGASNLTRKAARGVSPPYSPPEQYSGGTGPYSDVYAIGVTLHALLTGIDPPSLPFQRLPPTVRAEVEQVILCTTNPDYRQRYTTAGDMRRALAGAPPVTFPEPPKALRIESGQMKQGKYVNLLKWESSSTSQAHYWIVRKYGSKPARPDDGEHRGTVSGNMYADEEPTVGEAACYAVYAYQRGAYSIAGAQACAWVRMADVTNLRAWREAPTRVRLTWQPPNKVYRVIVRRSEDQAPRTPTEGAEVQTESKIEVVDQEAPRNAHVFYTVFCQFKDGPSGVYRWSNGWSIQVGPA
jgi:hypothetical protein